MRRVAAVLIVGAAAVLLWWLVQSGPELGPGEAGGVAPDSVTGPDVASTGAPEPRTSSTPSLPEGGETAPDQPAPAGTSTPSAAGTGASVEVDGFVATEAMGSVPEARITFSRPDAPSTACTADADGYFEAGKLRPGSWHVVVESKGQKPWSDDVVIEGEYQTLMLTLQPRLVIDLEIPDCDTELPLRVGLAEMSEEGVEGAPRRCIVAPLGERVWRLRLEGSGEVPGAHGVRVWVVGEDLAVGCSEWISAGTGTHRVRIPLEPPIQLRGRVVHHTGRAVAGAVIHRAPATEVPQPIFMDLFGDCFNSDGDTCDAEGRFALRHPAAGTWDVRAKLGGRKRTRRVLVTRDLDPITITFVALSENPTLLLLDGAGRPVVESEFRLEGPVAADGASPGTATINYTEEDGRCELGEDLPAGRYRCRLMDGRWGWTELPAGEEPAVTVHLRQGPQWQPVQLRLTHDGRTQPDAWFDITAWGTASGTQEAHTDDAGRATVHLPHAARYLVDLPPPDGAAGATRAYQWVDHPAGSDPLELRYRPGNRLELTVLDPKGAPVDGLRGAVYLDVPAGSPSASIQLRSGSSSSGPLAFVGLPECRCWVFAMETQGRRLQGLHRFGPFTVRPGVNEVSATIPQRGALEGRVVDGEGRPLHGVTVIAGQPGQELSPLGGRSSTTGPDGIFRFQSVMSGPVELRCWGTSPVTGEFVPLTRARVDVPPDGTARPRITLR